MADLPLPSARGTQGELSDGSAEAGGSPFGPDRTPYDELGGERAVARLVETFYDLVDRDPAGVRVRVLHGADLSSAREKLFDFLSGWLGGPPRYVEKHGHPRLRARHLPFAIGTAERDGWLACMAKALDECAVQGELRRFLDARFAHVAEFMRNRSP